MNTNTNVIGYLKKITVALEAGTSPDSMDLRKQPFSFQFIYGVGTEGVCLFEKSLFEKPTGEEVVLQVNPHQARDVFGHLTQDLISFLPPAKAPFYVKATISAVETADNRELVQAIAKGSGTSDCQGGCDCGCGC